MTEVTENVYHFSSGAAPTTTTMNALIDAFINWENTSAKGFRGTSTALIRCIATDLSSATGPFVDRAVLPQVTGIAAGVQAPNNVTVAVSFHTAKRGRSYRGRAYFIGLSTPSINGSFIAAAAQASLVTAHTALLALGVAPIFNLGILSGQQNKVKIDPRIWTPCTAVTVDGNLDSQRRRLPGHNRHN